MYRIRTHDFSDSFAWQDPHGPIEEMDELLNRQFALVSTALADAVPAVRAAAAKGVCCLLDQFWELIPAAVSVPYLKRLTG
jgi:condensin-2 complex subunit G2